MKDKKHPRSTKGKIIFVYGYEKEFLMTSYFNKLHASLLIS